MTREPTLAEIAAAGIALPLTPPFILEGIPLPLDILDALVERYLPGFAPGWVGFGREEITGGSVLYRMRQEDLGDLGTIKLLKTGPQESAMDVKRPPHPLPRALTQEEQDKLAAISDPKERECLLSIMVRLTWDERDARARHRREHQANVIKCLFNQLARDRTWQKHWGDLAQQTPTPAEDGAGGLESSAQEISVEKIDSFQKASEVSESEVNGLVPLQLPEADIKRMLREIIDEPFDQKDWGGETSDLFTTRVMFRGRRTPSAFLLKGPSVKGPMYIASLGKRGDQGQRLFQEPASLYVVQHVDKIVSAVRSHIQMLADQKAQEIEASVYYCFIDGADLAKLLVAYGKIQAAEASGE